MSLKTKADTTGLNPLWDCIDDIQKLESQSLRGTDLDIMHGLMGTPLHWAAFKQNLPVMRWLLNNGANPNVVHPTSGMRAIHNAIIKLDVDAVMLLLEYGAEPTMHSPSGEELIDLPWFRRNSEKGPVIEAMIRSAQARETLRRQNPQATP